VTETKDPEQVIAEALKHKTPQSITEEGNKKKNKKSKKDKDKKKGKSKNK